MGDIGLYSLAQRRERILRFQAKRELRVWGESNEDESEDGVEDDITSEEAMSGGGSSPSRSAFSRAACSALQA